MAQLRISPERGLSSRTYVRLIRVLGQIGEFEGRTMKPEEAGKMADLFDDIGRMLAPYAVDPVTDSYYQSTEAAFDAVMEVSPKDLIGGINQIIAAERGEAVPPETSGS